MNENEKMETVNETNETSKNEANTTPVKETPKTEKVEKSVEEQLAELRLENAKLKRAYDKSASDTANYKKQLRERQSVDEIAAQEAAERAAAREEEFQSMKRELAVSKFEKNFLALGYTEELAQKAATAQFDNDTDTLFSIQRTMRDIQEKDIKARLVKEMPVSSISNNAEYDPFLVGFNKK